MSDDEATGTQLIVHPNRWATFVTASGQSVSIRPPSVGEFRHIRDNYARVIAAEAEAEVAVRMPPDDEGNIRVRQIDLDGVMIEGGAAAAFSAMLDLIGSTSVRADDLPMWTAQSSLYLILAKLWRQIPIIESGGTPEEEQARPVQPHFQPPPTPEDSDDEEVRWPDVDPTAAQEHPTGGLQPGPVRIPART